MTENDPKMKRLEDAYAMANKKLSELSTRTIRKSNFKQGTKQKQKESAKANDK